MFITEEEALKRLQDSRNIFGENYVPDVIVDDSSDLDADPDALKNDGAGLVEPPPETPTNSDFDNLISGVVNADSVRRRSGSLHGKTDVQVAIGATAEILGNRSTAAMYGLSDSQTQAYNKGLSSSSDMAGQRQRNPDRAARLGVVKVALAEKAGHRLNQALTSLTGTKIAELGPMKLSAVAKDMAVIMDKVSKDHQKPESVHFHIFRPEMKKVEEYTTVHVTSPLVINNPGGGADSSNG